MMRRDDWSERLDEVLERARNTTYALGRHDCLRVCCEAVAAMTGRDYWPLFDHRYKSKAEALRLIRQMAHNWRTAISETLGVPADDNVRMAKRGDIVMYRDEGGEHLGIVVGTHVAVLGEQGLVFIPLLDEKLGPFWRID